MPQNGTEELLTTLILTSKQPNISISLLRRICMWLLQSEPG